MKCPKCSFVFTDQEIAKYLAAKGGRNRAKSMTAKRRREIAIKAVRAREAKRKLNGDW